MKKSIVLLTAVLFVSTSFGLVADYGWESGSQAYLGMYGNVDVANTGFSTDVAHSGLQSLKITEDPIGGTPQVYVGWVKGVSEGDVVHVTGWIYSNTTDIAVNPKGRMWMHYAASDDITSYDGSATNSNTDYAGTTAWMPFTQSVTVAAGKSSVVIEARIYSSASPANVIYVDDVSIDAPEGTTVVLADGTMVPEPATMLVMALGGLLMRRRK